MSKGTVYRGKGAQVGDLIMWADAAKFLCFGKVYSFNRNGCPMVIPLNPEKSKKQASTVYIILARKGQGSHMDGHVADAIHWWVESNRD